MVKKKKDVVKKEVEEIVPPNPKSPQAHMETGYGKIENAIDPGALRVVDLRKMLNENGIKYTSKDRKADLIDLVKNEIISKNKKSQETKATTPDRKTNETKPRRASQKRQFSDILENSKNVKDSILYRDDTHVPKRKDKHTSKHKSKYKIAENPINRIRKNEETNVFQNSLKETRKKHRNLPNSNGVNRREKRDPDFANQANSGAHDNLFDRSKDIEIDFSNLTQPNESNEATTNTYIKQEEDMPLANSSTIDTSNVADVGFSSLNRKEMTNLIGDTTPQIKKESESDISGYTHDQSNSVISTNEDETTDNISSTAFKIPLIRDDNESTRILNGPLKTIDDSYDTAEISTDVDAGTDTSYDLSHPHCVPRANQHKDQQTSTSPKASNFTFNSKEKIENEDPQHHHSAVKEAGAQIDVSLDDDSEVFDTLQHEFEVEHSKIEQENDRIIQKIESLERFQFYKHKFIRIIIAWFLTLVFFLALSIIREERIKIGFCGHEEPTENLFIYKYLGYKFPCIKCPEHAICNKKSQMLCFSDYKVSKPLFWSLFGIIPTFNKCTLDSIKVKRINKVLKNVVDILSRRNAAVKCGDGNNAEAGLNWNQIVEMIDQKLQKDPKDENYQYVWDKVKLMIMTRTDISISVIENTEIFRSISLARLSIKCRVKKLFWWVLVKYKFYLMIVLFITLFFWYIFHTINQIQKSQEFYKKIVKECIDKLQKQSIEYKKYGKFPNSKKPKYLAKIQLRDFYLPRLVKLSKKNRIKVWNRVVKAVEKNSNVKSEDIEVNGDIMRVWSWDSTLA